MNVPFFSLSSHHHRAARRCGSLTPLLHKILPLAIGLARYVDLLPEQTQSLGDPHIQTMERILTTARSSLVMMLEKGWVRTVPAAIQLSAQFGITPTRTSDSQSTTARTS